MNITHIDIDGFGKWQHTSFDINPQLQVFYGANEAGKTTLQRFITSILFGYATGRHPEEQYIPKNGSSYGGAITFTIDDDQHTVYQLRRTAGKGGGDIQITNQTSNQVVPPEFLPKLLGPVDRNLYEATFNFDLDALQQLTAFNQADLMSNIQRVGAVGSTAWLQTAEGLGKTADGLYKPHGRNPQLNQLLVAYHTLKERLAAATANYPSILALQRTINDEQAQLQTTGDKISQLTQQRDHLNTLKRLWPSYSTYRSIAADMPKQSQPKIDADDYAKFLKLQTQRDQIQTSLDQQNSRLREQDQEVSPALQFYLAHQSAFQNQAKQFDQIDTDIRDRQFGRQQLQTLTQERDGLVAKYHFTEPIPTPLSDAEITAINAQQAKPALIAGKSREQWYMIGGGALLVILGLLISSGFKWVLLLLGVAAIAGGWFNILASFKVSQANDDQSQDIAKIAKVHHLGVIPVVEWSGLQGDLQRLVQVDHDAQALTTKEQTLNAQINQFFEGYTFASDWLSLKDMTAAEALLKARQFTSQMTLQAATVEGQSQQRLQLIQNNGDLQTQLATVNKQLQTIFASHNVSTPAQFEQAYQQQLQTMGQSAKQQALGDQLTPVLQQELAQFEDEKELEARLAVIGEKLATNTNNHHNLQQVLADHKAQFEQVGADQTVPQIQQELANQETQIIDTARQWLATQLTIQWINEALNQASADRLPAILAQAETYFATLTMKHYTKLRFVEGEIQLTTADTQMFYVAELSRGTTEQLYVALRLSFAKVMADRMHLPIIVDDAFVDFDQERKVAMMTLLKQVATQVQVIYFTADQTQLTAFDTNQITRLSTKQN